MDSAIEKKSVSSLEFDKQPIASFDIDTENEKIGKVSTSKPSWLTFKNVKKYVKYISYALILLLTFYTIFSNILIKNDDARKVHDSKVDYAIKALFKVVQMTNGVPSISEISLSDSSNIEDLGSRIDSFINVLGTFSTTTEETL